MTAENRSIRVSVSPPTHRENGASAAATEAEEHPRGEFYMTPLIDIYEVPDGLILEADLPGASEDHLKIQLEDNVLSLHAHIPANAAERGRMIHEEYPVGDYARSFILSDEVERSRISAELKNGVLRLVLPKAERAKTRRIEIKS